MASSQRETNQRLRAFGQGTPSTFHNSLPLIFCFFLAIFLFIAWAAWCEIDEVAHGTGKIVTVDHMQSIQNLEGGIVKAIRVSEGDIVDTGQVLLLMDDTRFTSVYKEQSVKSRALCAQLARLKAEMIKGRLPPDSAHLTHRDNSELFYYEMALYQSKQQELESSLDILREQLKQQQKKLCEVFTQRETLERRIALLKEELQLSRNLEQEGAVAHVDTLKLERQVSDTSGEIQVTKEVLGRVYARQQEIKQRMNETRLSFCNRARTDTNRVLAQLSELQATQQAILDQIQRTQVRAPMKGVVNRVLVKTVGSVVQPGALMVELTPLGGILEVEARIHPEDIASLHLGQGAMIHFFNHPSGSLGSVDGKLAYISADTIQDEKSGNSFYLVRVEIQQRFNTTKEHHFPTIVGMTATVDIQAGKKTLLACLLKPILRTVHLSFTER